MKIAEILRENVIHIDQSNDGGSLEGYVTNTSGPQLQNYLEREGADQKLIEHIKQKFSRIAIFKNMYVDEDMRGQGHGSELFSDAIDAAAANGAKAIILVADLDEENAIDLVRWYEGYGFEIIGKAGRNPLMMLEL